MVVCNHVPAAAQTSLIIIPVVHPAPAQWLMRPQTKQQSGPALQICRLSCRLSCTHIYFPRLGPTASHGTQLQLQPLPGGITLFPSHNRGFSSTIEAFFGWRPSRKHSTCHGIFICCMSYFLSHMMLHELFCIDEYVRRCYSATSPPLLTIVNVDNRGVHI